MVDIFSFIGLMVVVIVGTPLPLASKIYYSQRNNRLRSAISHLYYMTSSDGLLDDLVSIRRRCECRLDLKRVLYS